MIVGFTGHRLSRMPIDKRGYNHPWVKDRRSELIHFLCTLEETVGVTEFISGVAIGWDTIGAWVGLEMGYGLRAYLPTPNQGAGWGPRDTEQWTNILCHPFTDVYLAGKGKGVEMFFTRNHAIVDDCDILLALWDGEEKGGTWRTIDYCRGKYPDKRIMNFWS